MLQKITERPFESTRDFPNSPHLSTNPFGTQLAVECNDFTGQRGR